jgi:hypothetical protein
MNRHRNEVRTPASVFVALFLTAAVVSVGGVQHAICKNQQVRLSREVDAIDRHIEQCRLDIRTTEMRMDQLLNRFVIRTQIEENGSTLRPIPAGIIEEIEATPAPRDSVASAAP